jgi:nucleotide-binding universal stress UspA family protein
MGDKAVIVYPTDFSEATEPAFELALESALAQGAELTVVHVLEPMPALADEIYVARRMRIRAEEAEAARRQFEGLLARAKHLDVQAGDLLVEGTPATEIVDVARRLNATMIVMGTHGRTGVSKLLLGSVAEQVIATAPCPVLTVRMR